MTYKVRLARKPSRFFRDAEPDLAKKLARCFENLENSPRKHPNIKPLKGELVDCYRYRIGDYRVIYRIDDSTKAVIVLVISHRRNAYSSF